MPMPGLNEVIDASKSHWGSYAKMKASWGRTVALYARAQGFERIEAPSHFEWEFVENSRRRDPSNIAAGAIKIVEDALQEAGLLKNDNWEWVLSFACVFKVDKKAPGVRLTVR